MNGLKIGIVTHNYPRKSSESKDAGKFIFNFAQELSKKARVFVFSPDFKGEKETYKQVPVTWFDWGGGREKFGDWKFFSPTSPFKFFKLWYEGNRAILKFIDENKIDFLLCFWNFPAGLWGMYAKKNLGVPYATWALGSDILIYPKLPVVRQLVQMILQNADKRLGNSYKINKEIKKLSGLEAGFLPTSNPVDIRSVKEPKFPKYSFNFVYLGRLEKIKGPDILVEAAGRLVQKSSKFTVTMIGGGSMEKELKERARKLKLDTIVSILGYVENQAVVNGYLKHSDCLVIPSRSESFPLVVTEALQTGLPIIGADVGDVKTFVGGEKLGYVFEKGNIDGLVTQMKKMIKNGEEMRLKNTKKMKILYEDFKIETTSTKLVGVASSLV